MLKYPFMSRTETRETSLPYPGFLERRQNIELRTAVNMLVYVIDLQDHSLEIEQPLDRRVAGFWRKSIASIQRPEYKRRAQLLSDLMEVAHKDPGSSVSEDNEFFKDNERIRITDEKTRHLLGDILRAKREVGLPMDHTQKQQKADEMLAELSSHTREVALATVIAIILEHGTFIDAN